MTLTLTSTPTLTLNPAPRPVYLTFGRLKGAFVRVDIGQRVILAVRQDAVDDWNQLGVGDGSLVGPPPCKMCGVDVKVRRARVSRKESQGRSAPTKLIEAHKDRTQHNNRSKADDVLFQMVRDCKICSRKSL